MPKVVSVTYQKLIDDICDGVVVSFRLFNFTNKGQAYDFASATLLEQIRNKLSELLREVPLTSDEEKVLDNAPLAILANKISGGLGSAGRIELKELPTAQNTSEMSGLTKVVFNATRYNYPLIARRSIQNSTVAETATYDKLVPLRLKDIAAQVHIELARHLDLPGLTVLLRALRYDFNHPLTILLRKEDGAHLAQRPITFIAQWAGKTQPMTGNTRTWHATVVAIIEIAQERLMFHLHQADVNKPQFLAANKDLLALVSGKVPTRYDEHFMVTLRDDLQTFYREGIASQSAGELNGTVVEVAQPSASN